MKEKAIQFLRWSEKYAGTDMIYATKGSFWVIFGMVGISCISFLKMLAFGRWLDQSVYGTYSFIISMAAILAISSLPEIGTSLVKAIANKKEGTIILAVKERMKYSLLGSFASFVAASWYIYNGNTSLAAAFAIVGGFLPFYTSFSLFSSFWMGRKDFKKKAKYELAVNALIALVMIPVIAFTDNPVLMVLALFASQSVFSWLFLSKTIQQKDNDDLHHESISFGKNLTIMGAINHFAAHIDKIILWKLFGPVQLAIYSFAQIPIQQIQGIIPIGQIALPKIGEKNVADIKEGLFSKFKKLFFISIPTTALVALIAPYLYRIALPQYIDSVPYFQAFSLLILLSPFTLLGTALIAEMKKRELYIIQTAIPILKMILFLALIPFFGVWGIIAAIIISQAIGGLLSLYFFLKIQSLS